MKIASLATVSLFVLSFAASACSSSSSTSSSSNGGSSEFAELFEAETKVTKDNEFGYWEIPDAEQEGVTVEGRLKVEEDRLTIAARCTYKGTTVLAGATSKGTIGDGKLTLDESVQDDQPITTSGALEYKCKANLSKGKGTYLVDGLTLTLLGVDWKKVADLSE